MRQRSIYEPPRVLQQAECLLETDLLGESIKFNMYVESVDIQVKDYDFTDILDDQDFVPHWD